MLLRPAAGTIPGDIVPPAPYQPDDCPAVVQPPGHGRADGGAACRRPHGGGGCPTAAGISCLPLPAPSPAGPIPCRPDTVPPDIVPPRIVPPIGGTISGGTILGGTVPGAIMPGTIPAGTVSAGAVAPACRHAADRQPLHAAAGSRRRPGPPGGPAPAPHDIRRNSAGQRAARRLPGGSKPPPLPTPNGAVKAARYQAGLNLP